MKLYFLDPHDYGAHWTVCAESPEKALEYCVEKMRVELEEEKENNRKIFGDDDDYDPSYYDDGMYYHMFKDATPDKLPQKFELRELPMGTVLTGENA